MNTITQDMKYRHSLVNFAMKHGVSRASRKYDKARSYIYFWLNRYDGSLQSLAVRSRRPRSHPLQHRPEEITLITNMRRRSPSLGLVEFWCRLRERGYTRHIVSLYRVMHRMQLIRKPQKKPYKPKPYAPMSFPGERVQIDVKFVPISCCPNRLPRENFFQYTAIDEFSRLRFLMGFKEISSYSSAVFLNEAVAFYRKHGITVRCIQTDNGQEFTNRLNSNPTKKLSLFEVTAAHLGIVHKTIRPCTPRHNGKVERSHREDQKRFYNVRSFYSFQDFIDQLKVYLHRSNNIPMRPLNYSTPFSFLKSFTV
ncbi:transposase [bacterium]|nr:transposase [bacterium]